MINELKKNALTWMPSLGVGYYPVDLSLNTYDADYFNKYQAMADSEIGLALNKARVDLVNLYTDKEVIDIGIGAGTFISARENTKGYDVNPFGVQWLVDHNKYKNPYDGCVHATFWDSLEHIAKPEDLLEKITGYVFVSIPIFRNLEHILESKHFRPDEHFWYFTHIGFKFYMKANKFKYIQSNSVESDLGREDIITYVFVRES